MIHDLFHNSFFDMCDSLFNNISIHDSVVLNKKIDEFFPF